MRTLTWMVAVAVLAWAPAVSVHGQDVNADVSTDVEVGGSADVSGSAEVSGDPVDPEEVPAVPNEGDTDVAAGGEVAGEAAPPADDPVPPPPADTQLPNDFSQEPMPSEAEQAAAEAAAHQAAREEAGEEESRWPLDVTASMITRYEARAEQEAVRRLSSDSFRFRARVGLITDQLSLSDDISVALRFIPQATGVWQLGGLADPALGLHVGSLEVYGGPLRLEVGRFEMAYGEETIIGTVDWHPVGRSFDGTRLRWNTGPEGAFVDAFFTVVREGSPVTSFGQGDTYFTGFYAGLGPHISAATSFDAYALLLVSPADQDAIVGPLDPRARVTLGSRFKQRFGMVDVRAEAGLQFGSDSSSRYVLAYQGDAEVGVNFIDDRLRFAVNGLYASGDDPDDAGQNGGWNHLFPTAHKFLGFADIIGFGGGINGFGRSNIASGVFRVIGKPLPRTTVYVHGHIFARPQDVVFLDPATMMPVRVGSGLAGGEVDVGAKWTMVPKLSLRTNYSIFVPAQGYYGTTTPAHFFELELRFTY